MDEASIECAKFINLTWLAIILCALPGEISISLDISSTVYTRVHSFTQAADSEFQNFWQFIVILRAQGRQYLYVIHVTLLRDILM